MTWRIYSESPLKTALDSPVQIEPIQTPTFDKASGYVPEEGLVDAVNVSLARSQPLLLTGEPCTGKSQLAYIVAEQLGLEPPLVFNTKTTSTARDLFYSYDALRHFRDSHLEGPQALPGPTDA